jgi:hypothetical protein
MRNPAQSIMTDIQTMEFYYGHNDDVWAVVDLQQDVDGNWFVISCSVQDPFTGWDVTEEYRTRVCDYALDMINN